MDAHHSHWLFQSVFVAVWCVVWRKGLNSQREAEEVLLKLLQSTVKGGEAGRGRSLEKRGGTGEWPCMWWLLLLPFLSVTSMNADTSRGCLCSGMWLCFSTRSLLAFPELLPKAAVFAEAMCSLDFSWTCILVAVLGSSLYGFYIFFAYYMWSRSISLYAVLQQKGTFSIMSTRAEMILFAFKVCVGQNGFVEPIQDFILFFL